MSIRKLPREPFFRYEGEETMHLLMTTFSQDIMSNNSVACVTEIYEHSTVFHQFSGHFSKIYTRVLVIRSFHAKEQFHYCTVSFKSNLDFQ